MSGSKEKIVRELLTKKRSNPFPEEKFPNVRRGHEYAWDVIEGKITASLYTRGACVRYVNDIRKNDNYYFNPEKAEKFLRLTQKFEHVIGKWESRNIVYEPWQCFLWMNVIGFISKKTGFRRYRTAHIEVGRGNAKALCLETKVPTPDRGLVRFGDLKIGDKLYSSDGSICKILDRNRIHHPESYRVHFSDGTKVDCSYNHLWVTSSKKERRRTKLESESVKTTEEIYKTQKVRSKKESNHAVKLCKPVNGDKSSCQLAYVLGYWLGDGHSGTGRFTAHIDQYEEIISRFKSAQLECRVFKRKDKCVQFVVYGLTFWLRELNLINNKHIPEKYFLADEKTRRELLRGLMDSDGTASKYIGNFTFCNTNKRLALGTRRLIASLGYKSTIREKISRSQTGIGKLAYYVTFSTPNTRPSIFGIRKKEDKRSTRPTYYSDKRYITKVTKIKKKPMFCIMVDSKDSTFLITDQYIPTHNSTMASQAALFFLALDDPNGNQISTVATKKEQARIVLDSSRSMARKNKSFLKATGVKVLAHSISHPETDSVMRALSSEHSGLDGLNDILAICDELHAMKRATFEVIHSGMSKRKDSLTLCITTAGFNLDNVGYSQTTYARQVALGAYEDEQFFALLYCLDQDDDIFDEDCWLKANPNWGVSVDPDTFRAKAEKAKKTPADVPGFTVKHLNRWLSEAHAFFTLDKWDKCADHSLDIMDHKGQLARIGMDLASHIDLASICAIVERDGKFYYFEKTYIPEETVKEVRSIIYDEAIASGHLIVTPGEVINYSTIRDDLRDWAKHFKVIECMYDPWNATEMAQNLSDDMEMVKFNMNTSNISEPMKRFDGIIREGKMVHNGSPLVRWCLGNVVAKEDHNGNVFPRKTNEKFKIDPVIAGIMGLAGWVKDDREDSAYESRGVRVLRL